MTIAVLEIRDESLGLFHLVNNPPWPKNVTPVTGMKNAPGDAT